MTKEFSPMLASPADFKILKYPLYASPKLDGIRAVVRGGELKSRKNLLIPNRFIQLVLGSPEFEGLDGELIIGSPTAEDVYRKTDSAVMRHAEEPDFCYYVFDSHGSVLEQVKRRLFSRPGDPFVERFDDLSKFVGALKHPRVRVHEHVLIKNEPDLLVYESKQIDLGYEGLILRSLDGVYKWGRSTAREQYMLKVKRFVDDEAEVLSWVQEMHNMNTAEIDETGRTKRSKAKGGLVGKGTMGALQVRDLKTGVEFEIGTGFTAADRARTDWVKKIVKYKHFPVGVKDKPRHPVFLGVRNKIDL